VLVARRERVLETLAAELRSEYDVGVHILAKDLTEGGAPRAVYETVQNIGVHVDVLVNSAGFGLRGSFVELPIDHQLQMIALNVTALTALTRLFLPGMLARNQGGVLNVASTAAFAPGPFMAVYYATKAYVQSLTEGLVEEVAHTNLRVSCLVPGPTATAFDAIADVQGARQLRLGRLPARLGWRSTSASPSDPRPREQAVPDNYGSKNSYTLPSFSLGSELLSTPRSTIHRFI
jgi:short-subunit dehydrogenase